MMKEMDNLYSLPHRRKNILTGEWILVSPHRTQRPWQGEVQSQKGSPSVNFDPSCYLCPGNIRANGDRNPDYTATYVFTNDFSALLPDIPKRSLQENFFKATSERGICRVVNYSPHHNLTLSDMDVKSIVEVIKTWQREFRTLSQNDFINYIQIFENKGTMMGNSNPHPHCQIWAQESIPNEPLKEQRQQTKYYRQHKRTLLSDYWKNEKKKNERVVLENKSFIVVVPFWAIWPFETLLMPKRAQRTILELRINEMQDFAAILKLLLITYDKIFDVSFPYSAGIHQAPTDNKEHTEWHWHMHFYPPLLRSATIKKFMVGYEMLAEPQRDITPEAAASVLKNIISKMK